MSPMPNKMETIAEEPEARLHRRSSLKKLGFSLDRRSSISNATVNWIRSKSGRISQRFQCTTTEEQVPRSNTISPKSEKRPEPQLRKSFSDLISLTKARIQHIVDPTQRVNYTRREQNRMIQESIEEIWFDKYTLDLPPEISQDKSEIEYLRRIQMRSALENLVIQDANLENGERTTEVISESLKSPQGMERSVQANEEMASGLAVVATAIAATSPRLPSDTVEITTEVNINENLVTRQGSVRVRTTRVPHNTPAINEEPEESDGGYFSLPRIEEFTKRTLSVNRRKREQKGQENSAEGSRGGRSILPRFNSKRGIQSPFLDTNKRVRVDSPTPENAEERSIEDPKGKRPEVEKELATPPTSSRNSKADDDEPQSEEAPRQTTTEAPTEPAATSFQPSSESAKPIRPTLRRATSSRQSSLTTPSRQSRLIRKPSTAANINAEAARIDRGLPSHSSAIATFLKFNKMHLNPFTKEPQTKEELSETRYHMRKAIRELSASGELQDWEECPLELRKRFCTT